jgi:hypothetical protein
VYELIANLYEKDNSMKQDPPPKTFQDGHGQPRSLSLLLSFQLCSPVANNNDNYHKYYYNDVVG